MSNYTPGAGRQIPKNLVEMAHDETGQWLQRDELETWVFRRFQRLEQQIKRLEEEHEAKVIQNVQLMRDRDAYQRVANDRAEQRDALAALFVRLQDGATDLIHASSEEEAGDAMELIAECGEKEARSILTRRDAEQQRIGAASFKAEAHNASVLPVRVHLEGVFSAWMSKHERGLQ